MTAETLLESHREKIVSMCRRFHLSRRGHNVH